MVTWTGLPCEVQPGTLRDIVDDSSQGPLLAQMRRGTLQYCVLALLESEERYGFDLVRGLAEIDGMVTSEGTIYPLLSRLRRDGLVESTWSESPAGPPRRYYRITESGKAALRAFRQEWSRFRAAVDSVVEGSDGR
jgi:PadR family transcriptional regulator PadR